MSMRMRQGTYYLKFATRADLIAEGDAVALVAALESATGEAFVAGTDGTAVRGEPVALGADRAAWIGAHLTGPLHMRARVRLEGRDDGALHSLEVNATAHPYTGAHVTVVDARIRTHFADGLAVLRACFDDAVDRLDPTWAAVHDTDDNAIQNCESAMMLRLGFGVDPESVEADRPGREVSRGEFRYAADWLGYLGPAVVERLAPFATEPRPDWLRARGAGLTWCLAERPEQLTTAGGRDAQRALSQALGFEAAARADRWTWGFFDKREPGRSVAHGDR